MNIENVNALEELNKVLKILYKHIKLIIVVTIIGILAATAITTWAIKPQYQSTAEIIVNQKVDKEAQSGNQQNALSGVSFVNAYKSILSSQIIGNAVKSKVGSAAYGQSKLSSEVDDGSPVINLSITANDPKVAAKVANVTASVFQKKVVKLLDVNNVSVISKAKVNNSPVSPDKESNALMGLLIGLVVGMLLALLVEYNATTIDSKEYITKELGLMDLGTVSDINANEIKKQTKSK